MFDVETIFYTSFHLENAKFHKELRKKNCNALN